MRKLRFHSFFAIVVSLGSLYAQPVALDTPPLPPLPSGLPSDLPPALTPPQVAPAQPRRIFRPTARFVTPTNHFRVPAPQTRFGALGDNILAWDSINKEYHAKPGELSAPISFSVTNISGSNVTINWVRPSCGCTVAKLPPTPWTLKPGDHGTIDLTVDLRGKFGTLSKYVSVDTSHGQKLLNTRVQIPAGAAVAGVDARTRNMQLAQADRQIVFRNDCASCHATPAQGRQGRELYAAACGICHEAPHRATMVPDLKALKNTPNREYWLHWIANGKPGSLMPAFAQNQGGPLTQEQIESLADYLTNEFPPKDVAAARAVGAAASSPPPVVH